jgi:hypothetical protein
VGVIDTMEKIAWKSLDYIPILDSTMQLHGILVNEAGYHLDATYSENALS